MQYEYTAQQAADYLGLDEQDMYDWEQEGGGPHALKTLGGQLIYRGSQLEAFKKKLMVSELTKQYLRDGIPGE